MLQFIRMTNFLLAIQFSVPPKFGDLPCLSLKAVSALCPFLLGVKHWVDERVPEVPHERGHGSNTAPFQNQLTERTQRHAFAEHLGRTAPQELAGAPVTISFTPASLVNQHFLVTHRSVRKDEFLSAYNQIGRKIHTSKAKS